MIKVCAYVIAVNFQLIYNEKSSQIYPTNGRNCGYVLIT